MTFSFLLVNILYSFVMINAVAKFLNTKINYKNYKIYVVILIITMYTFFMYNITQNFIRTVVLLQLYIFSNFYLHYKNDKKIEEVTTASVLSWMLLLFVEILTVFLSYLLFNFLGIVKLLDIFSNYMGISIACLFILIVKNKNICKIFNKIILHVSNFKLKFLLFVSIYISLTLSLTLYLIYFNLSIEYKLILFIMFFLEYSLVIYYIYAERKERNQLQQQLDIMINITSSYEKMLEENRINNHENKNQLIVIKGLISHSNKEALEYLNVMLDNNFQEDNSLLAKVSQIPMGGLRGLIYYKLLLMQSRNILCVLCVSKEINQEVFRNINMTSLQNFYKSIGVIIDNAIDAVEKLKQKIINIELYLHEEFFIVSLTNEYNETIDFDNLGKKHYTSKGKNHGYGLQLVDRMMAVDKNLFNEKEITGNTFKQKIGIRIQK